MTSAREPGETFDVQETREWLRANEAGMFDIRCQRCGSPFEHTGHAVAAPAEWYGLLRWQDQAADEIATLQARLAEVEAERDEYRFWNERIRVCEHHTQDIAAPVGDCLICNAEAAEERVRAGERVIASMPGSCIIAWSEESEEAYRAFKALAPEPSQ